MTRRSSSGKRPRVALVHSPFAAVVGLLALAVIGLGLVRGQLDLKAAGERAGIVLVIAILVDHLVVPVVAMVLARPRRDVD